MGQLKTINNIFSSTKRSLLTLSHLKNEIDGQGVLLESEVVHDVFVVGNVGVNRHEEGLALQVLGDRRQDFQNLLSALTNNLKMLPSNICR